MSEELSGRELEIAVAKALGWKADENDGWWRLGSHTGQKVPGPYVWLDAEQAWRHDAPYYRTDPVAFAEVLAALDAVGTTWSIESSAVGTGVTSRAMIAGWIERDAATYQEAMCRCFVAWRQP